MYTALCTTGAMGINPILITLKVFSIMNDENIWSLSQLNDSKIIQQLKPLTDLFKNFNNWPSISDYEKIFKQFEMKIKPVSQSLAIDSFEAQYEPRVYLKNELQTRTNNWHDFFNALIWLKFRNTKETLNSLHYQQAVSRAKGSNRSLLENRITQFDECGAIIVSNDKNLLELIRNHKWHELFIDHQSQFKSNLECVIFGHAIFEKALNPYIGMTCHCILLNNDDMLNEVKQGDFSALDSYLSELWINDIAFQPKKFHAFPVLGVPGYWKTQNYDFYSNKKYFR